MITYRILISYFLAAFLSGCVTETIKTTKIPTLNTVTAPAPESQLLDLAIPVFDPGIEDDESNDVPIYPELRKAEAAYMSLRLTEALQETGAWAAVRVVPNSDTITDLTVDGKILHSDGERLNLKIRVTDSRNQIWLNKNYETRVSLYAYEASTRSQYDPFQAVYNNIANDLTSILTALPEKDRTDIRKITELTFAQSFSPDAFGGHLQETSSGSIKMIRLPAENDPMLERVRTVRERDFIYVDTLQDYYSNFSQDMHEGYQQWRNENLDATLALREQQREYRARLIAGGLSVAAGLAASTSDDRNTRIAGATAVMGGGYLVKSGLELRNQAQVHIGRLEEMGLMLDAKITPRLIQLEDKTTLLTGTVEEQYAQWRQILAEIYRAETAIPEIDVGESPLAPTPAVASDQPIGTEAQ